MKIDIYNILQRGGVGVLPTDTLYGLVGSAFSKKAVRRIYKLKKRNPKKPLIILIGSFSDLARFGVKPDAKTLKILRNIWPGKASPVRGKMPTASAAPLVRASNGVSVILPCRNKKFLYLHRGTNTLAFRLPANPVKNFISHGARKSLRVLLRETGPLVAPSANPEGKPPARTIREAKKYFGDAVDFYADGGTVSSQPSALIAIKNGRIIIKRKGRGVVSS